jgi:hypothetical protein
VTPILFLACAACTLIAAVGAYACGWWTAEARQRGTPVALGPWAWLAIRAAGVLAPVGVALAVTWWAVR